MPLGIPANGPGALVASGDSRLIRPGALVASGDSSLGCGARSLPLGIPAGFGWMGSSGKSQIFRTPYGESFLKPEGFMNDSP